MIITIPHWLNLEAGVISMVLSAHFLQQLQSAVMNKWIIGLSAANKRLGSTILLAMAKMLMMMKTHSTLGREKTKKLVSK
jgi:hypothetical protein